MSRLFGLLVALVSVTYPFAVYFGAGHLSVSYTHLTLPTSDLV
mgnify:CR=1 FL=1